MKHTNLRLFGATTISCSTSYK